MICYSGHSMIYWILVSEAKDGLCWWKIEHDGFEGWTADHSREGRILLHAGQ